jgi:hypothetical protein
LLIKNKKSKALIFANVILGSMGIVFILAIFYIWYKNTSFQIPLNLKLGTLLTAGLLLSIVTLFMRNNWKINIAIAIFSAGVAAYGIEFVLFVCHNAKFSPAEIDPRNKLEVIMDLRDEGVDAWPHIRSLHPTESNELASNKNHIFPLGQLSQKTIVYCNESGQYKIFKSDEHGFNNPEGLYKKNDINIALVGDSFTLGNCVMSGEDIASLLRNEGINSLNLGNGGNGPLIELAVLKEYVEPFKADIVLWVYYEGNDLIELEKERETSMLMRYLEDNYSQSLLDRQDEIDATLIKYVNFHWKKELPRIANQPRIAQEREEREYKLKIIKLWFLRSRLGLTNKTKKTQNPGRVTNYKSQLPLLSKILATANQRSSRWGGTLYFVYLPTIERYMNDKYNGNFYDRDDVLAIIHKLGIPLIDFHEVLSKQPDPLSLVPNVGAHYNADGYKLLSEFIVSQLKKSDWSLWNDR